MKIRTRLSLNFIIITAVIYCLSLAFIYTQFKEHIRSEANQLLASKARMTAEMVLFHEDGLVPDTPHPTSLKIHIKNQENTSIYNSKNERVYSLISDAPPVPSNFLEQIRNNGEHLMVEEGHTLYGFKYLSKKNNEYLVISMDTPDISKLIKLRNILLFSTLITILILIISGWIFARQSLLSFSKTIAEINSILPIDLSKRLRPRKNEDELNQLISTFNQLLERIDDAFKIEKSFITNVSHELKNPITAIQSQIQYASHKDRTIDEYQTVLNSLQEDINEMSHMVEKLLQLARIQNTHAQLNVKSIRVDELIYQCKENILKIFPENKIKIRFGRLPTNEEEMYISIDEVLIKLAIYNLIENACKFSPDHTCQILIEPCSPHQIKITIQNYGDLITEQEIENIFKPFYRSIYQSHIKGSGIGLSLVKTILEYHKVPIEVKSTKDKGNEFIITFNSEKNNQFKPSEIKNNKNLFSNPILKIISIFILFSLFCCHMDKTNSVLNNHHLIESWYTHFLELNRTTDGYRPPVSARTFAYIGIGAWTCLSVTNPSCNDLKDQISGLEIKLPSHSKEIQLESCLNAYYYQVSKHFYPHAKMTLKENANSIHQQLFEHFQFLNPDSSLAKSVELGIQIANEIFKMASKDSISHLAYLYNYDPNFTTPDSTGIWQTDKERMPALLPHWGRSKIFTFNVEKISIPEPPKYSEDHQSEWFKQAWEIYTISQSLTYDEKWIAEFWSDDFHGITFCAASRWIAVTLNLLQKGKPLSIEKKLELLCKLGIGLNDAAVKTWQTKYQYCFERPSKYIKRLIDKDWSPLHEDPSFPAYPSGHSVFGAVSTGILTQYFTSDRFPIKDETHLGRKEFLSAPRTFVSLEEMAEENARSRMYMGVHIRFDCEQGLALGYSVANEVNKINFWNTRNQD